MRIRLLQMSESLILHQKVYLVEVNSFENGGSFKHSFLFFNDNGQFDFLFQWAEKGLWKYWGMKEQNKW